MQGEPAVNIRRTHLWREINYTRKPFIHGNLCKVKCLIQQRGASTSEPFRRIKCTFENIKTTGKTKTNKRTKEVKGKTCKTHRQYQTKQRHQHFYTYVAQTGHRSKLCVLLFLFILVFSMFFVSFCLDLFGFLFLVWYSRWFWYVQMYTWFLEKARTWMRSFVE